MARRNEKYTPEMREQTAAYIWSPANQQQRQQKKWE